MENDRSLPVFCRETHGKILGRRRKEWARNSVHSAEGSVCLPLLPWVKGKVKSLIQCHCPCLSSAVPVAVSIKHVPEQVLEELSPQTPASLPPLTFWKTSCSKTSPKLHPIPAWACGQFLELWHGDSSSGFHDSHLPHCCSAICCRTEQGNRVLTLTHSTLPMSLWGSAWKASHGAPCDGAVELLLPPAVSPMWIQLPDALA